MAKKRKIDTSSSTTTTAATTITNSKTKKLSNNKKQNNDNKSVRGRGRPSSSSSAAAKAKSADKASKTSDELLKESSSSSIKLNNNSMNDVKAATAAINTTKSNAKCKKTSTAAAAKIDNKSKKSNNINNNDNGNKHDDISLISNKKSTTNINNTNSNTDKTKPKKAQKQSSSTTSTSTIKRGRKPKLKTDDHQKSKLKNNKTMLMVNNKTKRKMSNNTNNNNNDTTNNIKSKSKTNKKNDVKVLNNYYNNNNNGDDDDDDDEQTEEEDGENLADNRNDHESFDVIRNNNNNNVVDHDSDPIPSSSSSYDNNILNYNHTNNNNTNDHQQQQSYINSSFYNTNSNNNNLNNSNNINMNNLISSTSAFSTVSLPQQQQQQHNQFNANYLTSTSLPNYSISSSHLHSEQPLSLSSITTTAASVTSSLGNVPTTPTGPVPMKSPAQILHSQPQHHHHHTHQALLSPPQNQNNMIPSNDQAHDLPNELLQQGWRKVWSKREGRFYFYNKNTNQSIWEMPKLSNLYDPMTDPLGIQAAPNSNNPSALPTSIAPVNPYQTPIHPDHIPPPIYQTLNPSFVPFAQHKNDIMSNDRKILIGPFDFEIEANCYIWEGTFYYYFHPHPDVELARSNFVQKLRQQYWELCRNRQQMDPPKDSFTKWLIERKLCDHGRDPILPSECVNELSDTLYREIINDIPIKLYKPKFSGEARKQLSRYAEASKKIIEAHHVSSQSRKIVKWNVEDAFDWIRRTLNPKFEDYIERLEHLKKQCQPHIIDAAKSSVEAICLKIYHVAAEYARRLRDMNLEFAKKEDLREYTIRMNNKKIACYPAYLMYPCAKLPSTLMMNDKDSVLLRCGNKNAELLRLNTGYLQKLEMLYYFNCRDDRKFTYFLTRVWCLLKRYQCFYDKNEGFSSQNSLPLSVFIALNKHFGVTFECFASPLNCYFRQYCSIFPDTDGYFGSRGSILNFYPISGSFQAYPPDSEDLINATIVHFEKLLANSMEPLSFIIFIQEKPDLSEKLIKKLESNKFKRMHLTIQAHEHEYRHGFQHICNQNEIHIRSLYNTNIYFLQNDSGFLKWGPTSERIEELIESFKLENDRNLSIILPSFTSTTIQNPASTTTQQQQPSSSSTSMSKLSESIADICPTNGIKAEF